MEILISRRDRNLSQVVDWIFKESANRDKVCTWKTNGSWFPYRSGQQISVQYSEGCNKLYLSQAGKDINIKMIDQDTNFECNFNPDGFCILSGQTGQSTSMCHNEKSHTFWSEATSLLNSLSSIRTEQEFFSHPAIALGDNFLRLIRIPSKGILPSQDGSTNNPSENARCDDT